MRRTFLTKPFSPHAVLAALVLASAVNGAEYYVSSADEIALAMQSAQPGDSLIMSNGVWTNQQISFAGFGESGSPITLRAETPGQVYLNGNSSLNISGDWLVADGLRFEGGALGPGDHIVEFRGSNGEATNSRFTNSAIVNYNPASTDTRYFWVSMYGQLNRVDNNYFSGQNHSGVTVTVWRNSSEADFHRIDGNFFADRPEGNGNGFETIRVGTSDESLSDSFTTVENNLFERVDGEIEIISNKSGANTFRYNTFRGSSGTLTLRHGNNNLVEGNFFLGEGREGTGGVRVIGEGQTVVNNYFQGLDGRAGGAVSISAGVPNSAVNEYYQVKDAIVAHNTIVDVNGAAIKFDEGLGSSGRTLLAERVKIANNAVWSTNDPLFSGAEGGDWSWSGNIAFGQSLGSAVHTGVSVVAPQLAPGPDGLYRPQATSPLIDGGTPGLGSIATHDMDGQPRVGVADVGADEYSNAVIVRQPLTARDVGPDWLAGVTGSTSFSGCRLALGCAIQAESYTSILDPDDNGAVWSVAVAYGALGNEVLKAPNGDRVDLGAEQHDTIATYDLEFESEGLYRAYYRARGFDSSSDSFHAPDGFGSDPDVNESISSNGVFRWERSDTGFVVDATMIGVPLELRLAMREQRAELDAFVLSSDWELSDGQLEAMFASIDGDYNNDGTVDAADYSVWRDSLGEVGGGLAADGDRNGQIGVGDYSVWRRNFGLGAGPPATSAAPEPCSAWLAAVVLLVSHQQSNLRNCPTD